LTHLVFVDGPTYAKEVEELILKAKETVELSVKTVVLPFNTGSFGYYGHKIYAAASQLVTPDIDWVLFLDQDNWYEPNHVESSVLKGVEEDLDFSYSLRKFYTPDKEFFVDDNCASLGDWKIWEEGGYYLIDTGCYCFRGSYITTWGHLWNMGWGVDINFIQTVMPHAKYKTTGERTFCYRLGSKNGKNTQEELDFITQNNALAFKKYAGEYPWEIK
jgi:hypothetical protein